MIILATRTSTIVEEVSPWTSRTQGRSGYYGHDSTTGGKWDNKVGSGCIASPRRRRRRRWYNQSTHRWSPVGGIRWLRRSGKVTERPESSTVSDLHLYRAYSIGIIGPLDGRRAPLPKTTPSSQTRSVVKGRVFTRKKDHPLWIHSQGTGPYPHGTTIQGQT